MKYKLDFDIWKETPENWSERDSKHIINVISVCRLGKFVKFSKYGNVSWEDEDKETKYHPIVEEQESFSKKSSNCMIFDLTIPNCPFDKIFVYQYKAGIKGAMGYYLYSSTNPDEHIHKYYLANEYNPLIVSLGTLVSDLDRKYHNTEIKVSPYRYHDRWGNIEYEVN